MKSYTIPLYIGISLSIVGLLGLVGLITISSNYIFCVSLGGILFAFIGAFEELLKVEPESKFYLISVKVFYFFGIFSLVALPTILENSKVGDYLKIVSDSYTVGAMGMVIITIGIREIAKEFLKWKEKHDKT